MTHKNPLTELLIYVAFDIISTFILFSDSIQSHFSEAAILIGFGTKNDRLNLQTFIVRNIFQTYLLQEYFIDRQRDSFEVMIFWFLRGGPLQRPATGWNSSLNFIQNFAYFLIFKGPILERSHSNWHFSERNRFLQA